MTDFDDDAGIYSSAVTRRTRRRKQAVVGVAGLTAILGGGAFLVTQTLAAGDRAAPDPAAIAPVTRAASPPADSPYEKKAKPPPAATKTATKSAVAGEKSPTPVPSVSESLTTEQRIAAARAAADRAGFPVERPLPQAGTAAGAVSVTNTGSLAEGGTLRVVSARYNLAGQRELAWAADDGDKIGDVRCTQRFRFSNDNEIRERPTMLLCWRTSDQRSVVTVAVSRVGRPDRSDSVDAVEAQWAKLG